MIQIDQQQVYFTGTHFSYWFKQTSLNFCEQIYAGPKIPIQQMDVLENKNRVQYGSLVNISKDISLNTQLLEYSSAGKGDYRPVAIELENQEHRFVSDLRVQSIQINQTIEFPSAFFAPRMNESTRQLEMVLKDDYHEIELSLFYTFYPDYDMVARHVKIKNKELHPITIQKLMSLQLDLLESDYDIISLNGTWGKEAQITVDSIHSGTLIHQSLNGSSSAFTNPGLMLRNQEGAFGFNLIYSGNHYNSVTKHFDNSLRVLMGLNPAQFNYTLEPSETFETPVALMTFSPQGQSGVTQNFHRFIRDLILVESPFEKPIVYNHWESTFFDYNEKRLINLAKKASNLGMDLFVIDDGWFGKRENDSVSLGDYSINKKKFPKGLKHAIKKIKETNMRVGLWVEPEMISEDSDLFRAHPEWVVGQPEKETLKGRNQWLLDLCQSEVQDYIIEQVSNLIDEYGLDYIKWDMNRNHSDQYSPSLTNQKEFDVRYQIGLVRVLREIFNPRPNVFLEMCASGGNRFDLSMLCVTQQIWTSDNTDAIDRLKIQEGTSLFYPLTCISNHVSGKINAQTLRHNPLSTRFNVAIFGAFGYELDLELLSPIELKEIKRQIKTAKQLRELILKGDFLIQTSKLEHRHIWQVVYQDCALVGVFQTLNQALQPKEKLRVIGLEANSFYRVTSIDQRLMLERFGETLRHVLPLKANPYGLMMNKLYQHKSLDDGKFSAYASGALLQQGILLNEIFMGTAYHPEIRIWGDFGSTLYIIKKEEYDET